MTGSSIGVDFTAADGTSYTNEYKYYISYTTAADEAGFLDIVGEMCWRTVEGCKGFVFFSAAADPYVLFKSDATLTTGKAASIMFYELDQSNHAYCDTFASAVGAGVDTSTCAGHVVGTECAVTCLEGYDQDGDYTTDGDTDTATCTADGGWVSASGWTLSSACSLVDYLAGFTTYEGQNIQGFGTSISFTTADGTSEDATTYRMTDFCTDCDDEALFLNEAAMLCAEDSDCVAMSYWFEASPKYVIFKRVGEEELSSSSDKTTYVIA